MASIVMKATVFIALVWAADGRLLCGSETCTKSSQCESGYGCYARRRGATVGKCLLRGGVEYRQKTCWLPSDCAACDTCHSGFCRPMDWSAKDNNGGAQAEISGLREELLETDEALQEEEDRNADLWFKVRLGTLAIIVFASTFCIVRLSICFCTKRTRRPVASAESHHTEHTEFYAESDSEDEEVEAGEEEAFLARYRRPVSPPEVSTEADAAEDKKEEEVEEAVLDIDDTNTCKICFDAVIDCVLLNCGHLCVCMSCAKRLRHCPMCRKVVQKRKRIYKA